MNLEIKKDLTSNWFKMLQEAICNSILDLEKNHFKFQTKTWKRNFKKDEGGGEYRILKDGNIFDKVGVNFSKVYGKFPKQFQKNIHGAKKDPRFWASGISVVMHMKNPQIPAMHFNTRYIHTTYDWFGGGIDVTPSKKDENEKKEFHKILKNMCDRHNKNYYSKYKKWCDEYFYLPHRDEPRGIGGIFYDYLDSGSWDNDFAFTKDVGETFLKIYPQLVKQHMNKNYTAEQREEQLVKRGRYAEFNLLYDRGTQFGLKTGGNTEAILMSLPPEAKWP